MDLKEKLALIEETIDTRENVLTPETALNDLDEWDSIAALSLIIMLDKHFEKEISGQEIKALKTIADILAYMEG